MALELPTNPRDEQVDMAPMIDMVFLLLVFFMVASKLNVEEHLPIEVPVATHSNVPEDRSDRINITVDVDGKFYLGATQIEAAALGELVRQRNDEIQAREQDENAQMKIFLRGDVNATHGDVREVMKICAENGSSEIIFSTHRLE